MIIPDINLLVYAYNSDAPFHEQSKVWLEGCLSGRTPIGIPWVVMLGFVRIMSSAAVLTDPMDPVEAVEHARSGWRGPRRRLSTLGRGIWRSSAS